jgi:hypothetical protein
MTPTTLSAARPTPFTRRRWLAGTLTLGMAPTLRAADSGVQLRFSGGLDTNDRRYEYPRELLELALVKAGSLRSVVQQGGMTQARLAVEVAEGRMDVLILPTSWPSNEAVMPVRVPLRRGLLGVRLLLARQDVAASLAAVRTLDELRRNFRMGYGADWIDRQAFVPLGFRMVLGSNYTGLFDMLRAGRFDYLHRGINELWHELDHPRLGRDLAVVPQLALRYPLDDCFWVRRGNTALAATIDRGLAIARADGSFAALYDRWFGPGVARAALAQRRVFELGGYPVEPDMPLDLFDALAAARRG